MFGVLCTVQLFVNERLKEKEGNMTIIIQLVLLAVIGFAALVKGADFFVEGSSAVAGRSKIPGVVIGLTVSNGDECAGAGSQCICGNSGF